MHRGRDIDCGLFAGIGRSAESSRSKLALAGSASRDNANLPDTLVCAFKCLGNFHMPARANIDMKDGVFLDKVPSYPGGRNDSLQVSPSRAFTASKLFQTDVNTT